MSPDSLMEIVNGRSMKQETLDAAPRIENPRPLGRGVRQSGARNVGEMPYDPIARDIGDAFERARLP